MELNEGCNEDDASVAADLHRPELYPHIDDGD